MKRVTKIFGMFLLCVSIANASVFGEVKDMLVDLKNDTVSLVTGTIPEEKLDQTGNGLARDFMNNSAYTYGAKNFTGKQVMELLLEGIALDSVMENGVSTMTYPMDIGTRGSMSEDMFYEIISTLDLMNIAEVTTLDNGRYLVETFDVPRDAEAQINLNYISNKGRVFEWTYSHMLDSSGKTGWMTGEGISVMGGMFYELSNIFKNSNIRTMPLDGSKGYTSITTIDKDDKHKGTMTVFYGPIAIIIPLTIEYSFGEFNLKYNISMNNIEFIYDGNSYVAGPILSNVLWFKTQILKTTTDPMVSKEFRNKYFNSSPNNSFDFEATKFGIDFNNKY